MVQNTRQNGNRLPRADSPQQPAPLEQSQLLPQAQQQNQIAELAADPVALALINQINQQTAAFHAAVMLAANYGGGAYVTRTLTIRRITRTY